MKEKPKSEGQWIKQTLDRYEAIEKQQPEFFDQVVDEWPEWVCKLWATFFRISHGGLNFRRVKKWRSKDLGRFLGRQYVLERHVWSEVPLSHRVQQESERGVVALVTALNVNAKGTRSLKEYLQGLKKWRPIFKKFIDETLATAHERPYPESAAFLEAFGKAAVIKPDELATERTVGVSERIAFVMFLFWRQISRFSSVGELHRFLSLAAAPMGIVISLKRVEKLCQRIGLKFKGRGRPKKGQIQTKVPAVS